MMLEMFEDWIDYVRRHERGAARIDPSIHGHVFGRISGIGVFEELIRRVKAADDIWIGTRAEAVAHVRASIGL
jgi:hypothetical protein